MVVKKNYAPGLRPQYGHFANERLLSADEIRTLAAWVNGGAQKGRGKYAASTKSFVEGWGIPAPDIVFQLPSFSGACCGVIDYQYVDCPPVSRKTMGADARSSPNDRAVVHHIIATAEPDELLQRPEPEFSLSRPSEG